MTIKGLIISLAILLQSAIFSNQVTGQFAPDNSIVAIDWSPNGQQIATINTNGEIKVWNALTGTEILTLHDGMQNSEGAGGIAWSPNGEKLAGTVQNEIWIWNASNWQRTLTIENSQTPRIMWSIAWSPDSSQIATVSYSGSPYNFQLWNSTNGNLIRTMEDVGYIYSVAWSSEENQGILATVGGNRVELWSPDESSLQVALTGQAGEITDIDWSPDGTRIASVGEASDVFLWDTSSNSIIARLEGQSANRFNNSVTWSPDNRQVASASDDGTIWVWDVNSQQGLEIVDRDSPVYAIAWSPDGKKLAYGGENVSMQIISAPRLVPYPPDVFTAVPFPVKKIRLSWIHNLADETNFRIERSTNGVTEWNEIATVTANQTTYTDNRNTCNEQLYYRVRAYRASDQRYSEYTPVMSVTTDGCGPDRLALFNTLDRQTRRFTDFPGTPYNDYWLNAPVASGRWVMGDWDGNGVDTPAVFNQDTNTFAFTNGTGATSTWVSMTLTVDGVPVAGRFNGNRANDCLGVVDDIPWGSDTAFALWFACDYTNLAPNLAELGYQWLGIPLANSVGYSSYGVHQFVTGDFDTDGVDTVAVRRGTTIAYGNTAPTTQVAALDKAQYFGNPYNGQYGGLYGFFVAGDWDYDGVDTFGYFYEDGNFYWRNHLDWNQPISGSALISQPYGVYVLATTWRN